MTVSIESSCPISGEKSGQLASNPGKNIGPKIRANGTRGAESPSAATPPRCGSERKELASLAIQVNTKRRYRAHIG